MTFDQLKPIEPLEIDALIGADFSISARHLTTLVARLAGEIGSAEGGGAVAILAEPGIVPSTAAIAALSSRRPYLPIAASYPEERIKYILDDSGATTVLAASNDAERVRSWGYADLTVMDVEILLHDMEADAPTGTAHVWDLVDLNVEPDEPAYLIYTSGSTGDPKGIVVSRANLANQLDWFHDHEYLTVGTRIIQKTPIGFDAAQWEILAPLAGAVAVTVESGEHRDPYALIARMQEAGVTTFQGVPTLLHAIVETGELPKVTSLRRIFSGGEALSWDLVAKLQGSCRTLRLSTFTGRLSALSTRPRSKFRPAASRRRGPVPTPCRSGSQCPMLTSR
ncbi:AMP-binding protein [Arthrobacter sp. H14]|uniref:AMP-binding protein n=1 Tax=Arthrobacter sp. H14 TaxID=1312959 RepID=UPI0004B8A28F|nr:AMP-binding protein [Arthrobacter sp. H14]